MAVNPRKGAPTSTDIVLQCYQNVGPRILDLEQNSGLRRTHRIHGSLAGKSQVSECHKKIWL